MNTIKFITDAALDHESDKLYKKDDDTLCLEE